MKCSRCEDTGWVCEAHPDRPWEGEHACTCGAAGGSVSAVQRHDRRRALEPSSTRRGGVISDRGWTRKFEDPIPLPRGRQLVTLEDAARYIQKLPKAEQQLEEWQTAVEVLILVAESNGGPTMMARIGVMQALNRNVERVFTSRKDHHWGKRKRARDRCSFGSGKLNFPNMTGAR